MRPTDLVDLVQEHDSPLGLPRIVGRPTHECLDDGFDRIAFVARFDQAGRAAEPHRHTQILRQLAHHVGLPHSGRPDQQKVMLAQTNPLSTPIGLRQIVVVDCHRDIPLGARLPLHKPVQIRDHLGRRRQPRSPPGGRRRSPSFPVPLGVYVAHRKSPRIRLHGLALTPLAGSLTAPPTKASWKKSRSGAG